MGEFKRATNDLKQSIEQETGLDEVRQSMKEVNRDIRQSFDSVDTQPATTGAETTEDIKDVPPDEKDSDRDKIDAAVAGETTEEIQRTPDAETPAKSKEDDAR
jgi:Sec-independent protein translocase protein TatA